MKNVCSKDYYTKHPLNNKLEADSFDGLSSQT
jgi:hypothetical protein